MRPSKKHHRKTETRGERGTGLICPSPDPKPEATRSYVVWVRLGPGLDGTGLGWPEVE